jgi:hypothetical protein
MSDNFIMFYNFIRRRWINSFLTFDNFFLTISLFYEPFKASLSQHSSLNSFSPDHCKQKRAPTITVDALPLVPAGTNVILLN